MNYLFKISSEYAILELGIGICRINEKNDCSVIWVNFKIQIQVKFQLLPLARH